MTNQVEQPTSPPDVDGPTSYYLENARERAITEALSGPRHEVYELIVDAIGNLEEGEYKELVDALQYNSAILLHTDAAGWGQIGRVVARIVDDYIMGIPRWQDRANDIAWQAWDDDQEAV